MPTSTACTARLGVGQRCMAGWSSSGGVAGYSKSTVGGTQLIVAQRYNDKQMNSDIMEKAKRKFVLSPVNSFRATFSVYEYKLKIQLCDLLRRGTGTGRVQLHASSEKPSTWKYPIMTGEEVTCEPRTQEDIRRSRAGK